MAPSRVFHVELVLFYMAGVSRGQIFKVQVDPLCGIYTDGPVAPQRWVGAQIIRREELSGVPAQLLVATSQGEESTIIT